MRAHSLAFHLAFAACHQHRPYLEHVERVQHLVHQDQQRRLDLHVDEVRAEPRRAAAVRRDRDAVPALLVHLAERAAGAATGTTACSHERRASGNVRLGARRPSL
jgi:hypothetical protein